MNIVITGTGDLPSEQDLWSRAWPASSYGMEVQVHAVPSQSSGVPDRGKRGLSGPGKGARVQGAIAVPLPPFELVRTSTSTAATAALRSATRARTVKTFAVA